MDNPVLKKKSDLHIARKIWHVLSVFALFLLYQFLPEKISHGLLLFAFITLVPLDFLRHRIPSLNELLVHVFKPIMRHTEVNKMAGTSYLIAGVGLIVLLFSKSVVALALLFLAFADPIASFVGIKYGKDKIFGHKSIQGFMAAYVVCTLVTLLYLLFYNFPIGRVLVASLIAGMVGALAELIPIAKVDDNFTLPVLSAIGLQVIFYFFGFFIS